MRRFKRYKHLLHVVVVLVLTLTVLFSSYIKNIFAAGDVSYTWSFTSAGDYTLSDSTAIEVSGSTARLKVQDYTSDSDTMLLYHLDESSGTPVDDSSSNSNDGTATAPTWATGNLNNGLSLDGATSKISIADSATLSLGQSNTLEMWLKLDSAFSEGANTKQGLIDKGDYQLYLDNETGKLTYELSNSSATQWTQVAGNDFNSSWDLNGKFAVTSSVAVGSDIYAGLGNAVGDAEIWKWNGTVWSQVGGDGDNSSWADQTFEDVRSLATNGTLLYAGLGNTAGDAEVWSCDTSTGCSDWTKIGGDAINSSWAVGTYEQVASMTYAGSTLYVGIGTTANDAEVWSWNGSTWTKIGGDSINSGWTTNFETVYSLATDGTNIYAGLGASTTDAEVWRWNGSAWTKIGGDGTNSSWNTNYEYVLSMTYLSGNLYAGIGTTAGDAEVWRFNGTSWTQIGGDTLNSGWDSSSYEAVYSLASTGSTVYAGLGSTAGDNEVWSWNGSAWTKIGGDGTNSGFTNTHTIVQSLIYSGSTLYAGLTASGASGEMWSWNGSAWTRIGGNGINKSWGFYNLQSVESLEVSGSKLYAGTGYTAAGNALVWEYDGSTWSLVGGQGVNSSWSAATYEGVFSLQSYGGDLYAGLGSTANDAEVWRYNGSTWTQVGGDSLNSGWTTGYEQVLSMSSSGGYLYVGLANSANDAEVWRWNGSAWTKIGGDSTNSGWTTNFESVPTLASYGSTLYAGLGASATDAEVWSWNGSAWTKIGGDGTNSSWNTNYEQVEAMAARNGELYVGLGTTAGDAEVWVFNGSSWSQIGGDDLNSSWTSGTYERVRSVVTYNGDIYATLGTTAGESEVWKYADSAWSQVGGDAINSSWDINASESVHTLAVFKGKLYAGLGETANVDAAIWSYGNNGYLQSSTSSFNTNWHHIAATYNGTTMKIYIDGVEDSSGAASLSLVDSTKALLIGTSYGKQTPGGNQGLFDGTIDELRISDIARTSFTTTPYSAAAQTISNTTAVFTQDIASFAGFVTSETLNGGTVTYRLSTDGGSTWKYWDGDSWETSASTSQANTEADINTNIPTLPISSSGIKWQAILDGDGTQQVTVTEVIVEANSDTTDPTAPSSITALSQVGGSSLTTNTWYTHTGPYFSWSGASDAGAGLAGYYVYFGTDNTAVPSTAGSFQVGSTYTASSLVSGNVYYLRIQAKDNAQNVSTTYAPFIYKFDSTAPSNPSTVTVTPSGYAATNSFTFSWPSSGEGVASDGGSGVAGYQYKTGAASGSLSDWSATTALTSVEIDDAAYQTDANTFYLRVVDTAGNVSATPLQATYYYAGDGPTAPQFLQVTPSTNTTNSFAFSWDAPSSYSGTEDELTYCYTVNTLPSSATCTYTSAGATSLSASSFATQVGLNTLYLAARNGSDYGSAINYGSYTSVSFTANTSAPGIPLNLEISDVSIKSTESWRLALSWTAPSDVGSGIDYYEIYRSEDDSTYSSLATTTGSAYIDTSLEEITYYYKVRACDSVDNCGAFTSSVELLPTGRFTEAATLESEPEVTGITTKKATISWSTDRVSDSKIQYGTSAGDYFDEEPSNSDQVTAHEISLSNLSPGTSYYAIAKWTDEDGNTGLSDEFTFETAPAPTVTDPTAKYVGIDRVTLQYTVTDASSVKIYYGLSSAFGSLLELATSTSETTYNTTLENLTDGTKYYYKINTLDTEDDEYDGSVLTFETLPRPKINNVRIQQVRGAAQPSVLVTWDTNTEVSSILTYYPEGDVAAARDEVNVELVKGQHRLQIRGLLPETTYLLTVKGRDKAGNEASSDIQRITTATDTRPPEISNLSIEGSVVVSQDKEATAQLVISWDTDEPATSQVEFGEGTGSTYSQKSQEDSNLTFNHAVVISGLNPSKVYHLRAISKDKANNVGNSVDTVTITPKASDNALNLVITNLSQVFGFLGGIK